jgi:hypothetical protein
MISDLSFFGVLLQLNQPNEANRVESYPRDLALHLEDEEGMFSIECLIFQVDTAGVRAIFKHGSFAVADRLLRYVARQKEHQLQYAEVV